MNDKNWKKEFKRWNPRLKPFKIKLLEQGAQTQSQACLLNDMWCEWKDIAIKKEIRRIGGDLLLIEDPWKEGETYDESL